jgi:hypothetical protein
MSFEQDRPKFTRDDVFVFGGSCKSIAPRESLYQPRYPVIECIGLAGKAIRVCHL